MRVPRARTERSADNDDDGAADTELSVAASLDMAPAQLKAEDVDAELQLCSSLATWVPWSVPTDAVTNSLAAIRSPATARRCMVRTQVVSDMIWEAATADELPTRLRYHAASRYRLRLGRVSRTSHRESKYSVATAVSYTHLTLPTKRIV